MLAIYEILDCPITQFFDFTGMIVFDDTKQSLVEALREKFGVKQLFCEKFCDKNNPLRIDCNKRSLDSIGFEDITIQDFFNIVKEYKKENKDSKQKKEKMAISLDELTSSYFQGDYEKMIEFLYRLNSLTGIPTEPFVEELDKITNENY